MLSTQNRLALQVSQSYSHQTHAPCFREHGNEKSKNQRQNAFLMKNMGGKTFWSSREHKAERVAKAILKCS